MSAEWAVTVPLWVVAGVSVVERSVGTLGSSWAASVEVAFLAERLCFANLISVLILLCQTTVVTVATGSHAADKMSQRAIAQTDIEGRRAVHWGAPGASRKSGLVPLFGGGGGARYRPAPARTARPKLRATEQRFWRLPMGHPEKSGLGPLFEGQDSDTCPRALPDR